MASLQNVQGGKVVKAAVKALAQVPRSFWDNYTMDDIRSLARHKESLAISQANVKQIAKILGVRVPDFHGRPTWNLDEINHFDPRGACPDEFQRFLTTMARHLPGTSELSLSSRVEVFHTQAAMYLEQWAPHETGDAPFLAHGQCSLSYTNANGDTLTGAGDLFIGGTDQDSEDSKPEAADVTFVVEVKAEDLARRKPSQIQLWTYMQVIHRARKVAGKKNLQVFGVISDSKDWRFMWLNQGGTCAFSKWYNIIPNSTLPVIDGDDPNIVICHYAYLLSAARCSSPATSNVGSMVSLLGGKLRSLTNIPGYIPWVSLHDSEEDASDVTSVVSGETFDLDLPPNAEEQGREASEEAEGKTESIVEV
ncbi:hypothetical protein BDZ88DRAFT_303171 [Geranomyces variabilis]|nr:hypothetical protein BDZ88DRAFT_303171 [Geranomyces variabilis]KAJ3131372.1 hypothetical protein HDU90_008308 [Geranomyces variabilis]